MKAGTGDLQLDVGHQPWLSKNYGHLKSDNVLQHPFLSLIHDFNLLVSNAATSWFDK
jgi:hypothetical protein